MTACRKRAMLAPHKLVGAQGHRHRTLGILRTVRQGIPQVGRLFLNAARIGDDQGGVALEGQKVGS